MALEIAAKQVIFDLLPTIDLRNWIASQCLSDNFQRSISKRIKTQVEKIPMAIPRFKIQDSKIQDASIQVYNLQDLCHITRRKESKTSGNEGLDGKNGKKICFFSRFYITMILWSVSNV